MSNLFLPTIGIISAFAVSFISLIIYSIWKEEKGDNKKQADLQQQLSQAASQASSIIRDAQQKANALLTDTHLMGRKSIEEKKEKAEKIERTYESDLGKLTGEVLNDLKKAANQIQNHYQRFTTESESIVSHHILENQKILDKHLEKTTSQYTEKLQEFLKKEQEKLAQVIQHEITTIHSQITAYEQQRRKFVDEHIVDLVSLTTELALKKKLTSQDHAEIIETALTEAKQAGFFIHGTS
jgi:F0F1-type ATP synthase membrane subunit b/b'